MTPKQTKRTGQSDRTERAWKLAQLAATLAAHTKIEVKSDDPMALRSLWQEAFLRGCVEKAEYLLNAAEHVANIEHAYELFEAEADPFMSLNAITEVFKRHQWKGLTSYHSVEDTVCKLLSGLRLYANSRAPNDQNTKAEQMVKEMEGAEAVNWHGLGEAALNGHGGFMLPKVLLQGMWWDPDLIYRKDTQQYFTTPLFKLADVLEVPGYKILRRGRLR